MNKGSFENLKINSITNKALNDNNEYLLQLKTYKYIKFQRKKKIYYLENVPLAFL